MAVPDCWATSALVSLVASAPTSFVASTPTSFVALAAAVASAAAELVVLFPRKGGDALGFEITGAVPNGFVTGKKVVTAAVVVPGAGVGLAWGMGVAKMVIAEEKRRAKVTNCIAAQDMKE